MSSSKQKKVHYERGNSKPSSSHRHQSSRDSGVGSSTASDRASLGTTMHDDSFSPSDLQEQRYTLRAVQEALDTANERIKSLEASNASLSDSLAESHKENRLLKKEKTGLLKENQDLLDAIYELNENLKRESSPRSMATGTSAERRPSFRKSESPRQVPLHFEELPFSPSHQPVPGPGYGERRASSLYERINLPPAPVPPPNPHPNPFAPRSTPVVTYAPLMTIPTATYARAQYRIPLLPVCGFHDEREEKVQDDGKYHLHPL